VLNLVTSNSASIVRKLAAKLDVELKPLKLHSGSLVEDARGAPGAAGGDEGDASVAEEGALLGQGGLSEGGLGVASDEGPQALGSVRGGEIDGDANPQASRGRRGSERQQRRPKTGPGAARRAKNQGRRRSAASDPISDE